MKSQGKRSKVSSYACTFQLHTTGFFDGENLCSHVKGVDMEITPDVWTAIMGLKYAGVRINKGNICVVEDFNKMQYYRSCLKNPHLKVRVFLWEI